MNPSEQRFGKYLLRTCHSVEDMRAALALQREVWHFSDAELVPVRLFVVGEKVGGHVVGAFDGDQMVGFSYGIPGYRDGHSYVHSHMLAVADGHRNSGLGRALKLFQRDIVMKQGIELIEWTFDPLEIKNAYLNIEKLGAIARRYTVNQYGITTSPLQAGLPTDRLYAEWWLNSNRVRMLLEKGSHPPIQAEERIDVPGEIYEWKAAKDPRASQVQSRNREQFLKHFKNGLAILGYERNGNGDGRYLLGHWEERLEY